MAGRLDLYGRELLAVAGTRIKAVNNKDRNLNSLQDFIRATDERLDDYRLDEGDIAVLCRGADLRGRMRGVVKSFDRNSVNPATARQKFTLLLSNRNSCESGRLLLLHAPTCRAASFMLSLDHVSPLALTYPILKL